MSPTAIKQGLQRRPLWTGLPGDDYLGPFTATANISLQEEIVTDSFYEGIENKLPITILSGLQCSVTSLGPVYNPSLSSLKHDMLQAMQRRRPNAHSFLDSFLRKDAVFDAWEQLSQEAYLQRFSVESASSHKVRIENNELFNLTLHGGKTHLGMMDENQSALREAVCTGRHFFTTDRGLYGLGPAGLSVGDEIHVVLDCQVPIALRRPSKHWDRSSGSLVGEYQGQDDRDLIYVGQVYVHELMVYDGDLAKDIDSGKVELSKRFLV
ncbi:putative Heterokaryon incompatibility domain-containing protein [Seiridium cardinale]